MANDEKYKKAEVPHTLILEQRSRMSVSGVENVESFDENEVIMYTNQGMLTVSGSDLRIERLTLDGGELGIEGHINGMKYEEVREKGGVFSRLFR